MQINPKIAFAVAIAMALIAMAAQGSVALPLGVPEIWGKYITSWSNFAVNVYVIAISPVLIRFGLNFTAPNAPIAAVTKGLAALAVLCLVALHVGPAFADPDSAPVRPAPLQLHLPKGAPLTGNATKDVSNAAAMIAGDTSDQTTANVLTHILIPDLVADLTAAQAVYVALKDDAGAACNQSILTQIQAFQSAVAANPLPKIHLAYDFAVIRSLLLGIQPNSPIYNSCATIATQTGQTAIQLVTGIITGTTSVLPVLALGQ